jgi:hypothetical protein
MPEIGKEPFDVAALGLSFENSWGDKTAIDELFVAGVEAWAA